MNVPPVFNLAYSIVRWYFKKKLNASAWQDITIKWFLRKVSTLTSLLADLDSITIQTRVSDGGRWSPWDSDWSVIDVLDAELKRLAGGL